MDQDFHYYGTYYAARVGGGYSREDATRIAKASNFIDFLSNEGYAGYWRLVRDTEKRSDEDYDIVAKVDYPRYTYQGNLSTGVDGSRGLWASYHFAPGNYADPANTPSDADIHGKEIAGLLPGHQIRTINPDSSLDISPEIGQLLNRPQSALSRTLIQDTIECLTNPQRLEAILERAAGGEALLNDPDKANILKRFGLVLLGARAHVIADTWAHQDWSSANNVINTYWDVSDSTYHNQFAQRIEYQDIGDEWNQIKLSSLSHLNLSAVPNGTSYLGHGWMGHFPDYSFVKYRYKPCWRKTSDPVLERDNPTEFKHAFLELCSLFCQTQGNKFQPQKAKNELAAAQMAISEPCEIDNKENCPRKYSQEQWITKMQGVDIEAPIDLIDTELEPHPKAVLDGQVDYDSMLGTRYGTYYINFASDLYLFEIAADYHFQFMKNWLTTHDIGTDELFTGSWSKQLGPISEKISEILA